MPCFTRLSSLSLVQTGFICAMIAVSLATVSSVTAWGAPSAVAESCSSVVTTATQAKAEAAEQSGDDATATQQYLAAANCGLAKAQRQLGLMLLTGRGGAKNETEAADWLGKAAAQGDALGQLALATLLRNGLGVAKNEVSAHQRYLAAAKQGLPMAQYYVGTQFSSGRGTTMDKVEAARWFYRAAFSGHALAQMAVAHLEISVFDPDRSRREHLIRAYSWARLAGRYTCTSTFKPSINAAAMEPNRKAICETVDVMRAAATDLLKPNELTDAEKLVDAWASGSTILPALSDDAVRNLPRPPIVNQPGDRIAEGPAAKPVAKREFSALDSWMIGQINTAEGPRFIAVLSVFDGSKRRGYIQLICPERSASGPLLILARDLFDTPPQNAEIDHFNGIRIIRTAFANQVALPIDFKLPLSKPMSPVASPNDRVRLNGEILGSGKGTFSFRLDRKDEPEIVVRQRVSRSDPAARTAMAEFDQQNFKPSDLQGALLRCQGLVKPQL
jgi:hypothetical protein